MNLADEIAMLAVAVERAKDDAEALVLCRLEFEALWVKFRSDTQAIYDAFTIDARDEHDAAIHDDIARLDLEAPPQLKVLK